MKVFEVTCEYCEGDSKEVITEHQYVTASNNDLATVADYFTKHCYEYEKQLLSVREILTIVQQIETPSEEGA